MSAPSGTRRRPSHRGGRPTLTRERVAEAALDIAGAEGFGSVTMRRVAQHLDVTVRALYRYVTGRQDLVDLTAAIFLARAPRSTFDLDDWEESVRRHCGDIRRHYRSHPRVLLGPLDENVTPSGVDEKRIVLAEDVLRFLTGIGLSLADAVTIRNQILLDVFAFVLAIDHTADRLPTDRPTDDDTVRLDAPVPEVWLDAHPELDAPLSRAALDLDVRSPDEMFDDLVDNAIAAIRWRLDRSGT
ncbi:MAG: TetR family transcriptional regulator [Actinomycetota bacterium]